MPAHCEPSNDPPRDKVIDRSRTVAELEQKLQAITADNIRPEAELRAARGRQNATAESLEVIARSPV
ncbi:hypothetical protein SAMN05216338_104568 [Bradyrhizobium sp. Rc2d]|uniref:hypothetical protein n=1 Tax=Bradyrhizobium sp. Rc2d TaxID=1855321 RepID=UPI000891F575|nr:hypothetical protein [Bradyrhizobium sp. Rc2d]SDJ30783.1 hypothetical protein SAMN05216338_104568 [Bradyrhizobium sp. Rc2d]